MSEDILKELRECDLVRLWNEEDLINFSNILDKVKELEREKSRADTIKEVLDELKALSTGHEICDTDCTLPYELRKYIKEKATLLDKKEVKNE